MINDLEMHGGYSADEGSKVRTLRKAKHNGDLRKKLRTAKYLEGGDESSRSNKFLLDAKFTKGEILRENTKKTGLKSFKEDKKPKKPKQAPRQVKKSEK